MEQTTSQQSTQNALYAGSVAVAEPLAFGSFDVALNLNQQGSTLSAQVNAARTMVYGGAPSLQGSVGPAGPSGHPTFTLTTSGFESSVTGRRVTRTITFEGEFDRANDRLTGSYTETINGYTSQPITVKGSFLLVRSFSMASTNPGPDPNLPFRIYLPLTRR